MIEHVRNVPDRFRPLGGAQRQIVILRQIEFLPKTAKLENEGATIGAQVPDIHRGNKQLWVPLRFEERRVAFALFAQSVLVAVENVGVRNFHRRARQFVERERRQDVVVIQARDKITGRHFQRAVAVFRDAKIFVEAFHANSFIARLPAPQSFGSLRTIRSAIDDA